MLSSKIRKEFLQYFKDKDHSVVPSSPVIPHDDPTLLFCNAGMNQFKDVFLGKTIRDYSRAATSQKCIRVGGKHNDLDNVGHTSRHMTFFEMMGNFSFGDYFKEDAIQFAFDLSTSVFAFAEDKLFASIYEDDDEAFEIWKKYLPEKRIVRMGKKDNFWSMGEVGPCGPCTELFYDKGKKFSSASSPLEDAKGERFLEFWNLVFMQYNLEKDGAMTPLPKPCVDTGSGLERVVSLIEGVDNVFLIDIFQNIIRKIESTLGVKFDQKDENLAPGFYVIADHLRALSFAIVDGVIPSNVDRGYVLRKILRRAVRYGRLLGAKKPFLSDILPALTDAMGQDFPELASSEGRIQEILAVEEESFLKTLSKGGNILSTVIEKTLSSDKKEITGEDAFKLKDTYGFPLEEILLIAKDSNLTVNLDAYAILEEKAKELSKSSRESHQQLAETSLFKNFSDKHGESEFVGYTEDETESTITAIVKDGRFVDKLEHDEEAFVLLDKTPFYAEKGGQVSDLGFFNHSSAHFDVLDCQTPYPGVIIHHGKLSKGCLLVGEPIVAKINMERREQIENNHSATHLLHWALQKVLGEHIKQAGSLVEPCRLRFDFHHHKPITQDQLHEVERLVNEKVRRNSPVKSYELSYSEAQEEKNIKQFFGDKYGSTVRVIDIADFSKELCGGTHVQNLGSIGLFRIAKESSIAKGIRRIEAFSGKEAMKYMLEKEALIDDFAKTLNTTKPKVLDALHHLVDEHSQMKKSLKQYKQKELHHLADALAIETIKGLPVIAAKVDVDPKSLNDLANILATKHPSFVIMLALDIDTRCQILIKVSKDLTKEKNLSAKTLLQEVAPLVGASGGGNAESAQAGGKDPSGISNAIEKFKSIL